MTTTATTRANGRSLDVLVVGAGPVGLSMAIALRAARGEDLRVLVLEQRKPSVEGAGLWLDKVCGEGLMPSALLELERLGVCLEGAGQPFAGIRYWDGATGRHFTGRFRSSPGRGLRRTELSRLLFERALSLGVEFAFGEAARDLVQGAPGHYGVRTSKGRTLAPSWLIAADGLRSALRRLAVGTGGAGEQSSPRPGERFGLRTALNLESFGEATPEHVEVFWGHGVEAYVTPLSKQSAGLAFLVTRGRLAEARCAAKVRGGSLLGELSKELPALGERYCAARSEVLDRAQAQPQGVGPLHQPCRRLFKHNLVLLGDAAGYQDAITGEGLALGFHQARALATVLLDLSPGPEAQQTLLRWQRRMLAHRLTKERITRLALLLSRRPGLRRGVFRIFERWPAGFEWFLELLEGEAQPTEPS